MTTDETVAHGIKTTAGVVTGAALVMFGVFSIFASLQFMFLKEFGVGLAIAVLVDATIVRAVLLPATMKLLGDWKLVSAHVARVAPHARPRRAARTHHRSAGSRHDRITRRRFSTRRDVASHQRDYPTPSDRKAHTMFHSTRYAKPPLTHAQRRALAVAGAILVGLTTMLFASSATATPLTGTTSKTAQLQHDIDALVAAGAPGASLRVRAGNTTTRLTAGVAELATHQPIAQGDHYRIASLTKTYVATVVLQLVAERKLNLSDSVARWLPGLLRHGNKITVRMLLNHTSGLYDHEKDPEVLKPYLSGDLGYYWSPTRLVKLADSRPAHYAPGHTKVATYSSTNYSVLGLVVTAVTGRSIGTELKQRIFQPLHLAQTSYPTSQTQLPQPYAHGYFNLGEPSLTDVSALSPSLSGAAGAIVSTVGDVARFYRALLSGHLLAPPQLKAMQTTLLDPNGDLPQRMGYGLIRFSTSCGPAWGHSGSFPGYWTHGWSSPNGKRQVVLMVNIDPTAATPDARAGFYKTLDDAYCASR